MPVDYRSKYMSLKSVFMSTVDAAWRDGFENGLQQSQMDQAQQQSQQADAMAQAQAGAPQPGQPGEQPAPGESPEAESQSPVSENPNGDELGQHIEKLESMLGKSEISSSDIVELQKTLNDIKSLQTQISLTKSMDSAKHSHKHSFSPKVQANLPEQSKKALSLQENIVKGIFEKWEKDSQSAASDIGSIIKMEGLIKG